MPRAEEGGHNVHYLPVLDAFSSRGCGIFGAGYLISSCMEVAYQSIHHQGTNRLLDQSIDFSVSEHPSA